MRIVQIPISQEALDLVENSPLELGLNPYISTMDRHSAVYKAGFESLRKKQLRAERLATYELWAQDPECLEVAEANSQHALESGLL